MIPRFRVPVVNRSTILVSVMLASTGAWVLLRPPEPETLVTGQRRPAALAIESGTLYWTTVEDGFVHTLRDGTVTDLPDPHHAPVTSPQQLGSWLAVRNGGVHWTLMPTRYGSSPDGSVVGMPGDKTLAVWGDKMSYFSGIAVSDSHVFWVADGKLFGRSLSAYESLPPLPSVVLSTSQVTAIAADETSLYWLEAYPQMAIRAAALDGTSPRTVLLGVTGQGLDASAPDDLVLITYQELVRVPKAGGTETQIASAHGAVPWIYDSFVRVTVSGDEVFATTMTGNIVRVGLDGSGRKTLARRQRSPTGIATDDEWVYWAESDAGRIRRLRRP